MHCTLSLLSMLNFLFLSLPPFSIYSLTSQLNISFLFLCATFPTPNSFTINCLSFCHLSFQTLSFSNLDSLLMTNKNCFTWLFQWFILSVHLSHSPFPFYFLSLSFSLLLSLTLLFPFTFSRSPFPFYLLLLSLFFYFTISLSFPFHSLSFFLLYFLSIFPFTFSHSLLFLVSHSTFSFTFFVSHSTFSFVFFVSPFTFSFTFSVLHSTFPFIFCLTFSIYFYIFDSLFIYIISSVYHSSHFIKKIIYISLVLFYFLYFIQWLLAWNWQTKFKF